MKYSYFLFLFFIFAFKSVVQAQSTFIPIGRDDYQWIDHISIKTGKLPLQFNTANKSIDRKQLIDYLSESDTDNYSPNLTYRNNINFLYNDNFEYANENINNESFYPVLKYIYKYKSDFFVFKDDNFTIKVNPVLNYHRGQSNQDTLRDFANTRGIEVRGNILNKIGFYTYMTENQMRAPIYVQQYIANNGAVPGQGYYKDFKVAAIDYLEARGYVTFTAAKYVHFTFGQDKNFIGDGIRSLFISDASNVSPFFKINTHYKRFDYQNLFMQLTKQWNRKQGDQYTVPKYAAMHHLSYNVTDNLQFGLFEAIIFSRHGGYEISYLNPVIFYRQVEQMQGSPDNASMGADMKWNLWNRFQLYEQFYLDEFNFTAFKSNKYAWTNKYAVQVGIKYPDAFTIKNLDIQLEENIVRPFTYSHKDTSGNYTNYNQPLAHPLGANFKETIFKIYYQPTHKLTFNILVSNSINGLDSVNGKYSWGGNPMRSYRDRNFIGDVSHQFKIGDGVSTQILIADLGVSYQLKHNLYLDFTYIYRNLISDDATLNTKENYVGIGVRLNATRNRFLF